MLGNEKWEAVVEEGSIEAGASFEELGRRVEEWKTDGAGNGPTLHKSSIT